MKSKVLEGDEPMKIVYPLLAKSRHTGAIVLFSSLREGTLIVKGSSISRIGDRSCSWNDVDNPDDWTILNEVTITIYNMKVEVVSQGSKEAVKFPLIARCSDGGHLVLFSSNRTGTVLTQTPTSIWEVGYHSVAWIDVTDESYWTVVNDLTLRFTL